MELQINGEPMQVGDKINIDQLLSGLELNPKQVVVELNRNILTPEAFPTTVLIQGDILEIVQFVGGG